MRPELSVLIPARNEMFLQRTIEDVLEHSERETEIIVVLDGYWPEQGIPQHPRVTVIHHEESIGQRAATNEAARVARAPFLMKLDAHCSVGQGFDRVLIETHFACGDPTLLQVPTQFNLHVFDWVCKSPDCDWSKYQGPTPPQCEKCGGPVERKMLWRRRDSRKTTAWRFDADLHFQYWSAFQKRQQGKPNALGLSETMSLLGACWFVSLERFWGIDGLDEEHGSWGQMGTELGCKQWLSGSPVMTNHKTWFAHMFRTQGKDFGFPYPMKHQQTEAARRHSWNIWRKDNPAEMPRWPKAERPLAWMIEHFSPVPDWEEGACQKDDTTTDGPKRTTALTARPAQSAATSSAPSAGSMPAGVVTQPTCGNTPGVSKGVVYYTDCRGDETILGAVRRQLRSAVNGHRIVSASLGPVEFGDINIWFASLERGYLTMFRQILGGLEMSDADVVFLCEHDVLYPPEHFDFTPPKRDVIYYNENVWKVDSATGRAIHYLVRQTSGLCAYRETLLAHYKRRVELVRERGFSRRMGFEPGTHGRRERVDDLKSEAWMSERPLVDIRHGLNLTPSRWSPEQFRDKRNCKGWTEADEIPGWGRTKGRFAEFLSEAVKG